VTVTIREMYLGNERLHTLYVLKLLLVILCFWGISGAARAENPLFQPIMDENLAAIEYLVRQGFDVNQPNEFGLTPLEFAIRAKSVPSAQLLFRYGASFALIDQAVINEFRIIPGIGQFLEQYAHIENRPYSTQQTRVQQTRAQQTFQQPQTQQNVTPTQPLPQQSLAATANTQQSRSFAASSNTNLFANQSHLRNLSNSLRPQNSIGIASLENSTITMSPRQSIGPLEISQATTSQTTTFQSTEEISALKQSSNSDNQVDAAPTVQETLVSMPAPSPREEIAVPTPEIVPNTTQGKLQQVHFDNPSQTCQVKNYNLVVTFTFDDGETTDLEVIEDVFVPRKVTGTLGIVLDRVDSDSNRYMDSGTLKGLQNMGWEIASHTINHNDLTSLNIEDLDADLLKSHQGLGALGLNVSSLIYPYGENNKLVRAHTSKYYYGAFEGGYRLNTRSSNPFKLKRFHIADAHDFKYYKRVTDSYSDQHGWLVWAVHTNINFEQQQIDDMHQLLDYMCDQGIRVVNAREGLDHLNLVDYE